MRFLTVGLCFLGLIATSFAAPSSSSNDFVTADNVSQEFALLNAWKGFKEQFSKSYDTPEIEAHRYSIFVKNVEKAAERNKKEGPNGARHGVTRFMDLDEKEFSQQFMGYRPKKGLHAAKRLHHKVMKPTEVVDPMNANVDWFAAGAVTPVKDQGGCGSCWAFSTTEEVESMWFMKHKVLPVLSPQQIVDCDSVDQGCNGGDTVTAYQYVKSAGLETEKAYPYAGVQNTCAYSASHVVANITGFTYATPPCTDSCLKQNENTLLNNLASHGPVSICVYAESWQTYVSGIFSDASNCPSDYSELDHCVQLTGYQSGSTPYWIVRNSWNTNWGEAGFIYIKFGENLCGIADEATFATSG